MSTERTPSEEELAKTRRHIRLGGVWGWGFALVIVGWVVIEVAWH